MSLDKMSLTVYDFLGYLLPGYVLVFGCSLLESTFLDSDLFCLSRLTDALLLFTILAYFLGHAGHRIGSLLKDWRYSWFRDQNLRLSAPVFERVRKVVKDAYGIKLDEEAKLDTLETYLLADSYVVASGGSTERDVLMAREGFSKASMVAFGFLSLILFSSLIVGGTKVQTQSGTFTHLTWITTTVLAMAMLCLTLLFRRAFIFYNRIKINNTLLTFLALREKDILETKE
jgi:hypothetical protein